MLTVIILDTTAHGRHKIAESLNRILDSARATPHLIPPLSVRPVALEEAPFVQNPGVVLLGQGVCLDSQDSIRRLRSLFPHAWFIACLPETNDSLWLIDQLSKMSVDECLTLESGSSDILKRFISIFHKRQLPRQGRLIVVDGCKGGVGVTTICASLGSALAAHGSRCVVVDGDTETQDLARFTLARPYINEGLQKIITQTQALTEDSVLESLSTTPLHEQNLAIVSPPMMSLSSVDARSATAKSLLSYIQLLDGLFETTIIDCGCYSDEIKSVLYKGADEIILILNNNPASLHATLGKIQTIKRDPTNLSHLKLLENGSMKFGLPSTILRSELCRLAGIPASHWIRTTIPFDIQATTWAGSSLSFFSSSKSRTQQAILEVCRSLAAQKNSSTVAKEATETSASFIRKFFTTSVPRISQKQESTQALPIGMPQNKLLTYRQT